MSSPIDCPSSYFPGIFPSRLIAQRERERQFLRKDELIDADHSYIPDLSRKGQREGQERAICVNGHCLYPLKNNPPIYTISREANVKKHNRLATLEQTSVSRIRL